MMGDRDYNLVIKNALEAITRDLRMSQIDPKDKKTIHLPEVVRCLRRSYYDRVDPIDEGKKFEDLLGELLRKLPYGSRVGEFAINEVKLKAQAEMIVDDVVIKFKTADKLPEDPFAEDILYVNACLWIYNKIEGIIVYMTGEGERVSFYLSRDKKMFEEIIRRVRVLSDLLGENKVPILEPSPECMDCQYYERCYIKKKMGQTISLKKLFGVKQDEA